MTDEPPRSAARPHLSEAAVRAWNESFLGPLGPSVARLLDEAEEVGFTAGEILHRVDAQEPGYLAIVVSGLVRVYAGSAEGRRVTVRYLGSGDALGLPQTLAPAIVWPGLAFQAHTDGTLLKLDKKLFWHLVATERVHLETVYEELVRSLLHAYELLSENVFSHVRNRVARHLLDLASREEGQFVVRATQQELADSIGSVREVVSRAIGEFRDQGIIRRTGAAYVIADPAKLHRIAGRQE